MYGATVTSPAATGAAPANAAKATPNAYLERIEFNMSLPPESGVCTVD
jgi:hypothetical protein